ncbi:MAG: protein TolQ [Alphaproteobacteria bacterium]|nr:MAG: protein TolQ [Alphaproteobacteria bacterium]TAF38661.1 MAG: protein TolQ [Alphaproteobacteria bacterium]
MPNVTQQTHAAVGAVGSTELAGSVASADMSILGMFMQADLVVKAVMLGLLISSFISWAIIFDKIVRLKDINRRSKKFEQDFWSTEAVENFYENVKRRTKHPFAIVFMAAMEEWLLSGKGAKIRTGVAALAPSGLERIAKVMSVSRNRELEKIERGLSYLATVGSAAPFVGLFGTVWGIMNSFQSIAFANNTSLAVVAPGIAEALLATAIGLFAAIPSVIAYNRFSADLGRLSGHLEDFEIEFMAMLSRQAEEGRY